MSKVEPFCLDSEFVDKYRTIPEPFHSNPVGHLTYHRTYSRLLPSGVREKWYQTVERVVNGTYRMQQRWITKASLGWKPIKAQRSAQEMYDRIFHLKFTPPGRGLWAMGSPLIEGKKLYATLNNCAFVSTNEMVGSDPTKPFIFLMDASMLGIGVGFDTRGAGCFTIQRPARPIQVFTIPDSREGWVESVERLLRSYFQGTSEYMFDYSKIRPRGEPIKNFGGTSSGPEPLRQLHKSLCAVLEARIGKTVNSRLIVDIMNLIGVCVVAGNVRRTAEIAFGEFGDQEYLNLKNFEANPERAPYAWTSNNTVFAPIGANYEEIARRICDNGEPGLAWLENMRLYGRMDDPADNADHRVMGGNPCLEQSLESYEMCCLVETFPSRCDNKDDFLRTLKFAYLYAKTVTLGKTHWPQTNRVMLRNRRIGCSLSGITHFISQHGLDTLRGWCEDGYRTVRHYDGIYSDWMAIPRSIKTTSIKPSGTVSLLAGLPPGMHFGMCSRYHERRINIPKTSEDILDALRRANIPIEQSVYDENSVLAVMPVDLGEGLRTEDQVSMWEQLSLAAFLQRYWSDNQVSCTIKFDRERDGADIARALDYFQYQLKGISFLAKSNIGHRQAPYTPIDAEAFATQKASIKELHFDNANVVDDAQPELFCDGDACLRAVPAVDSQ